ncbi:HD domain-containing protein [Candidatus Uhrbacteria bacterium]|nr:HD domain-containing protein [Candidatus Uhrbacteria bacterium]
MKENRDTFFDRLAPVLDRKIFLKVKLAYILAKYGHRWQIRMELDAAGQSMRYFEHPRRVALILIDELQCFNPIMIITALLHDCIEDTHDIDYEFLNELFGQNVAHLVMLLSKVPKEGYIERLLNCDDWRALMVKVADRLDNLRHLDGCKRDFQRKQVEETREKYFPILERLLAITPEDKQDSALRLQRDIFRYVEFYELRSSAR